MSFISETTRVVFVGGGKMGEAILGGWLSSEAAIAKPLMAGSFQIIEPTESRREYLSERYGVSCVGKASEVERADIVVLAVKPQVILEVLRDLRGLVPFSSALFVSIAAGVTTDCLVEALPETSRLVRVMPNLPLLVGEGASVVCGSRSSHTDEVEAVRDLFACLGLAEIIDEKLVDAAGALSGSGPAYVAAMIESLTSAGCAQGLPESLAEALALQTVYGTALHLKETAQSPTALREAVCSPGGTTLAALSAMKEAGMDEVYRQGVAAAVHRSKELGSCKA